MIKVNTKGLDNFQRKLEKIGRGAKELQGTHTVSFGELFTAGFMSTHTPNSAFDDFVKAGGFNADDFASIPDAEWDAYIARTTKFANWQEMKNKAAAEYALRRMGLG